MDFYQELKELRPDIKILLHDNLANEISIKSYFRAMSYTIVKNLWSYSFK